MQLVLSNNRIIAHGGNYLAMGGVVIDKNTGVKFDNATIAECEGCPSDIDKYPTHDPQHIPPHKHASHRAPRPTRRAKH